MGIHVKSLNDLASIDTTMDRLAKAFKDFNDPKPAAKLVEKSSREAALDKLDQALAVLKKGDNKSAVPKPVTKAMTQVRPQVHIRDALGDQSLGTQNAGLAKAAAGVELYGSMASVGTMEAASAKVAKAANGQVVSKAVEDEDDDADLLPGIMI